MNSETVDLGARCTTASARSGRSSLMLDAAGLLWGARRYFNPADAHWPAHAEQGNQDDQHYRCLTYAEAFYGARQAFRDRKATRARTT